MEVIDSSKITGKIGGNKTLAKHGREHFVKMGKLRWSKNKKRKDKKNVSTR